MNNGHRKRVKHFHLPGHCHELTFSCYQRRPLLANDVLRGLLSRSIEVATERHGFRLCGFVYMPEHVHLLVWPESSSSTVNGLLKAIKQPFSHRAKRLFIAADQQLLAELTIQERPGKIVFRFWQEGGGYDRNLTSSKSVRASLDYLHLNPVRRGFVETAAAWKWSSARFFQDGSAIDLDLPKLFALPPQFWDMPA